jgi:hypothetical protein
MSLMSAIGPKRTSVAARACPLLGVHMIATATSASRGSEHRMDRSYCALASSDSRR